MSLLSSKDSSGSIEGKMILSIIVPVYNVEAYLEKCVDSLLNQDLSPAEYEIILVNDGSTDSGGRICDRYAGEQDNIRVIHQTNRGLSAARNTGISAAKGRYIQFVDSDDYLNPNVLRGIVYQMETQKLDILRINYQNVNSQGKVFEPNKYSKPFVDYSEEVCDGLTFLNERLGYACYAVQFVIKASILKQEGNSFKEGIYFEDVEWAPRILLQAQRVASSPAMVYNYLYRRNSITRDVNQHKKKKAVEDKLTLVESMKKLGQTTSDSRWFNGMISQTILSIIQEISCSFYSEKEKYIDAIKKLRVFPLSTYQATPQAAHKIRLANLSPKLLVLVYHFKNGR